VVAIGALIQEPEMIKRILPSGIFAIASSSQNFSASSRLHANMQLFSQIRSTWVFRHARRLPKTSPGELQRNPSEKQEFQMYHVVQQPAPVPEDRRLQVILTDYVEGYGNRGDVVEVPVNFGRFELILAGKALYATPFNLKLMEEDRKKAADYVKLTKYVMKTARALKSKTIVVPMNLDNEWTLEKWNLRVALRKSGFDVPEAAIRLPEPPISGPDPDIEAKLFRFYVTLNRQVIVPCVLRLHHEATTETKRLITAGIDLENPTADEFEKFQINVDEPIELLKKPKEVAAEEKPTKLSE